MKSKGEIKIGNDADFSIVDLNKELQLPMNGLQVNQVGLLTMV